MAAPTPTRHDTPLSHDARQDSTRDLLLAASHATAERRHELQGRVVELNHRVALAVARRYAGRGVAVEDLEQVACEGLVKAVRRFDVGRDRDLLDYAVPTIRGEVLRHFRDHGWSVRPPRRVQELQHRMRQAKDDRHAADGREPTDAELVAELGVSRADYDEAATARGCFTPTSLDQPTEPGSTVTLGDLVPAAADEHGAAEARAVVTPALRSLGERQRRLIHLRFVEDRTQGEIGAEFGVTQATVSRWLAESLDRLRSQIDPVAV